MRLTTTAAVLASDPDRFIGARMIQLTSKPTITAVSQGRFITVSTAGLFGLDPRKLCFRGSDTLVIEVSA